MRAREAKVANVNAILGGVTDPALFKEKVMDFLCKYFFGPLILTGILIGVFETVNPPSWPKAAVGGELLAYVW